MARTKAAPAAVRRRVGAAIALAAAIVGGLLVHTMLPDTAGTDIAGDALYALAVYVGLVMLAPRAPSVALGAIAIAWCVGVELFQLTGIPLAAGAVFPPVMLVLGTVFDARDLLIYAVTIVLAGAADTVLRERPGLR